MKTEDMFEDGTTTGTQAESLARVQELAAELVELNVDIENAEGALSELKAAANTLSMVEIPEAMGDLTKVELRSGWVLTVKPWLRCKDTPAGQAWLEANDLSGIIKDNVTIQFDKGEHEEAKQLFETLSADGYTVEERVSVHNSTLRATLSRLLDQGVAVPEEAFEITRGVKTHVKAQ